MSTNNSDNEDDMGDDLISEEDQLESDINDMAYSDSKASGQDDSSRSRSVTPSSSTAAKDIDGISKDNWKLLDKVKNTQMQDKLRVSHTKYPEVLF